MRNYLTKKEKKRILPDAWVPLQVNLSQRVVVLTGT